MKINLGANNNVIEGYLNIDIDPNDSRIVKGDMLNLDSLNIKNGEVEEIQATHVLEYIPFQYLKLALETWFNKLKSGGTLILTTWDMQMLSRQIAFNQMSIDSINEVLFPQTKVPIRSVYTYPLIYKIALHIGYKLKAATKFTKGSFVITLEKP